MKFHHERKIYKISLWSMSEVLQFKPGSSNCKVIAKSMVYFSHLSTRCISWKKKDFKKYKKRFSPSQETSEISFLALETSKSL